MNLKEFLGNMKHGRLYVFDSATNNVEKAEDMQDALFKSNELSAKRNRGLL